MRVKEIKIEGLFGMFDHTISLKMEERLSIVYGINGIGKTMVFKILDSLFNSDSLFATSNISKYPFRRLIIIYENESILNVQNTETELEINFEQDEKVETISFNKISPKSKFGFDLQNITKTALKDILNQTSIFFIDTQRLIKLHQETNNKGKVLKTGIENSVDQYSREIAEIIKTKRKERDKLSNDLQQSLNNRILSNTVETRYPTDLLNRFSKSIEKRIEELKKVGLLESIQLDNFKVPEDIDALKRAILSVNIQDIRKTLAIFDDLYSKFQKFIEILNERRLSFKKIAITDNGFVFTNDNNKILKASDLSSGEQHELVLLYLLLFKIPENSLILIDEPEISLHIVWQKAFLDDMKDIIKLRNFDIVVATHSPAIINGNWDLTIKLDGNGENE